MFGNKDRGQRLAREAKAIQRKAKRHGGELSGRDAARLREVNGRIVKYGNIDNDDSPADSYNDWE